MHSSGTGSEGLPLEGATELRHHRVTFELDDGAAVLRLDVPPPPSSEDHITLTGRYRIALPEALRDRGGYRELNTTPAVAA